MSRATRPRLYSKSGCATCKKRKKKCDEVQPVCGACARLNMRCVWAPPMLDSAAKTAQGVSTACCHGTSPVADEFAANARQLVESQIAAGRIGLPQRVRPTLEHHNLSGIEYFAAHSVPLLESCQPMINWKPILGYLMQETSMLKMLVAIGCQQRRLTCADQASADVTYHTAVSSWRLGLERMTAPAMVLGCLLLIILESLRGNADALRIHLRIAVRIAATTYKKSPDVKQFLGVLQSYCTSVWLYEKSSHRTGVSMQDFRLDKLQDGGEGRFDLHYQIQALIAKFLATSRLQRVEASNEPQPVSWDPKFREDVARVHDRAQDELRDEPLALSNLACTTLLDLKVNYRNGDGDETAPFPKILTLLERCNQKLRQRTDCAFAVGIDIAQKLDLILALTKDVDIRRRAQALLRACPSREGVWSAKMVQEDRF